MLFSFSFSSVGREMEEIFKLHVFAQVCLVVGYDIHNIIICKYVFIWGYLSVYEYDIYSCIPGSPKGANYGVRWGILYFFIGSSCTVGLILRETSIFPKLQSSGQSCPAKWWWNKIEDMARSSGREFFGCYDDDKTKKKAVVCKPTYVVLLPWLFDTYEAGASYG